jgi:hypothetical protein
MPDLNSQDLRISYDEAAQRNGRELYYGIKKRGAPSYCPSRDSGSGGCFRTKEDPKSYQRAEDLFEGRPYMLDYVVWFANIRQLGVAVAETNR